jgi:hypothetical protein
MTTELETHATVMELSEPAPAEIAVGADLVLKVKVTCSAECDMRGMPVKIATPDGVVATGALATHEAGVNVTGEIAVKAPQQVGEQPWTITFEQHETATIRHASSSLPLILKTIPQGTSLAVWDIPSPVVMGERFSVKVGAKSAAGCELKDNDVEVCDQAGTIVARGRLQETPWPGTSALYWTAVELVAPEKEGLQAWSVKFSAAELALPHDGAVASFSAAIVKRPEHRLTVKVIEKEGRTPIEDAQIRLGAFRAATGPSGIAEVMMPKGTYELYIWKTGFEAPTQAVDIKDDVSVEVEAIIIPEEDPDAAWSS